MTEYFDKLIKMSDIELISIKNGNLPFPLSAASTTTLENVISEAEAILHERHKKIDLSTNKRTFWILFFTVIGVIIALLLFLFEYVISISKFHKPTMIAPYSNLQDHRYEQNNDKKHV